MWLQPRQSVAGRQRLHPAERGRRMLSQTDVSVTSVEASAESPSALLPPPPPPPPVRAPHAPAAQ
eukprot:5616620-Pleurochrysis_carterae.AAC.4